MRNPPAWPGEGRAGLYTLRAYHIHNFSIKNTGLFQNPAPYFP